MASHDETAENVPEHVLHSVVIENYDIPPPENFKLSALFDFGIAVINELPSKQLNTKVFDKTTLNKYRVTNEEANVSVNPVLIAQLLLLLAHCADDHSKTESEITKVLHTVLGKPKHTTFAKCREELDDVSSHFSDLITKESAIRIFFEQRDITPIRKEFQKSIKQLFQNQNPDPNDKTNIIQEMNFAIDPTGEALYRRINQHMYTSTDKMVKTVVRRDLAPDWRCRMMAAGATNDCFYIRAQSTSFVDRYFYDGLEKNERTRTITRALIGTALFRMLDNDEYRMIEFIGKNNMHTLVIIMPKEKPLSDTFLKDFDAAKFTAMYLRLHKVCPDTTEGTFSIPTMHIVAPTSLRSIFCREKSWWPWHHNPLAMNRAFCPYKAEFAKIISKKSDTPSRIFALHDIHIGCKFAVRLEAMKPVETHPEEKLVLDAHKPITIKNTTAKVVTIHQTDGEISNVIIDLNVRNIGVAKKDSLSDGKQPMPVAPPPSREEAVAGSAKDKPVAAPAVEVVAAPPRVAAGADKMTASTENRDSRDAPPPPLNASGASGDHPPNGTQSQEAAHNASNKGATYHPQVPFNEMSQGKTVDSEEEELPGPRLHKFVVDRNIDPHLVMTETPNSAVVDRPFFFVVLHRGKDDNNIVTRTFMPRAMGRFTNVEEVYKEADVPSDV